MDHRIYMEITKLYPGLFKLNYNGHNEIKSLSLIDQTITEKEFVVEDIDVSSVLLATKMGDIRTDVRLRLYYGTQKGYFHMTHDFDLSKASCMGLFSYNIEITYNCFYNFELKTYDRTKITREYTLNNIING